MKNFITYSLIVLLLLGILTGCSSTPVTTISETAAPETNAPEIDIPEREPTTVDQLLQEMSLEEKIWQMFFVMPEDICNIGVAVQAGETTKAALQKYPVGGLIYFSQNVETREQITQMLNNTSAFSKIPPFLSIDEEGGRVSRLGDANIGVTVHPPMAKIGKSGDPEQARKVGLTLGKEMTELGFNMDFAPVADIITVESNTDIGDRSFGTDPELVAKMVAAQVEGMQSHNLSATLKHFPGCGSTAANTHVESGASARTLEQMRNAEFLPFKAGIDAGADVVMVAHMSAPSITGDQTPATLSPKIVTDLLRGELGFQKVVISDALNMGAITSVYSPEDAAVMAVQAGVDMLLMSPDIDAAAEAIKKAVETGEIPESRIDESVQRILTLKQERGRLY